MDFRVCPNCGYKRGFHSSFQKENEKIKVIFICPECGSAYDLGMYEERLKDISPKKVNQYD